MSFLKPAALLLKKESGKPDYENVPSSSAFSAKERRPGNESGLDPPKQS